MILKLNINFKKSLKTVCWVNLSSLKKGWENQKGAFPPFMFGLLMGVTLFSTISIKIAEKQLLDLEGQRETRLQKEREDLVKGLEFSILTETAATYSSDLTLERARAGSSLSSGQTISKDDVQFIERRGDVVFGTAQKKVLIANTDDVLNRSYIENVADGDEMNKLSEKGKDGVSLFDSSAVRYQQVETSMKRRDAMAETIYRYYASQLKFPTPGEYENLAKKLRLTDVWGNSFIYTRTDDDFAVLTFVTPWGEEFDTKLDMR